MDKINGGLYSKGERENIKYNNIEKPPSIIFHVGNLVPVVRSEYFDFEIQIWEKPNNGEGFDMSDRSVSVRFKRTSNVPPFCGAKSQRS